ncbi:VOC family protein [Amycolatopsis sp. YIM 10]|uniref:VOC family protein n=1 Tax=Amycolatopsis sp. YIM 10 TaxID=2653857 RepID=UPI0012902922|nr:VOC family protein [Amycolatopsis sp. YIM 10]QFU92538.1 Glyoxalase-like domain protein [Amycolatopsis sp. YIM 10]
MTAEYPLTDLHHVGVVVPDLEAAVEDARERLGMEVRIFPAGVYPCRIEGRDVQPVTQIALSVEGPPHLELVAAVPGNDLWRVVPGLHHLGFVVDDVPGAARRMAETGAPLVMGGIRDGKFPVGATYHRDPLGHLVELLDAGTAARFSRFLTGNSG